MEKFYSIGEICEALKCEQHNLRYIEKTLDMKIKRDEFMTRLYTQKDLDTFQVVFELKSQGLNYAAIKKVLEQQEEVSPVAADEVKEELALQNNSMEQLIKLLTKEISESVAATVDVKFQELSKDIQILKIQNVELQREIEKSQDKHFSEVDNKLAKVMEELRENRNKSWLTRLLAK